MRHFYGCLETRNSLNIGAERRILHLVDRIFLRHGAFAGYLFL